MKPGLAATLVDKTQSKQISFLFGAVAFIGGVSGLLIYFQKRKFSYEINILQEKQKVGGESSPLSSVECTNYVYKVFN